MARWREYFSRHTSASTYTILAAISFILLLVSSSILVLKPREWGMNMLSGVQHALTVSGRFVSGTINSIGELRDLEEDFDLLQEQVAEYQKLNRTMAELKEENIRLREQLGFGLVSDHRLIPAEVIGKDPGNLFNAFIINRGRRDGVLKNMPVIAYQEGIQGLVGRVLEAGNSSSKVLPIFDSTSYIAGRLAKSRHEGLINGAGISQGTLVMRHINKLAEPQIREGDLIVTSGFDSIFPREIYVGRIISMLNEDWETEIQVEIAPILDFSRIEYVFVVEEGG